MTPNEAYEHVRGSSPVDFGRFYSSGEDLALGKGKIYDSILYPLYHPDQHIFASVVGLVYVLTHECDVDQENVRIFNEDLLICPVIPLETLVAAYQETLSDAQLVSFLTNLGARNIFRVVYIPPYPPRLPFGGLLYLNQITNTHVEAFSQHGVQSIGAVSAFGLVEIEYALENHLLRPKEERLAFAQ